MPITARQATIHDLDRIAPLFDAYRQFYEQPADLPRAHAFLAERFKYHQSVLILATDATGDAVGFTQLYPLFSSVSATRTYLLNDLFVAPRARRTGVADLLMQEAENFARSNGAAAISLSTALNNTSAQKLYESRGWKRDTLYCEFALAL